MSAEIRQALADAASSVDGLTGHPYFVQTSTPGNVLVRLERMDIPNRFGPVGFWNLVLILPQDQAAAEAYMEANVPALIDALAPHLAVTGYTPQQLQIDGLGTLPTVFVNGHRED